MLLVENESSIERYKKKFQLLLNMPILNFKNVQVSQ